MTLRRNTRSLAEGQLRRLLATPALYPAEVDLDRWRIGFVQVDEALYRRTKALDVDVARRPRRWMDLSALQRAAQGRPAASAPTHYIFHSAFCGSTLLSRMLDVPGSSFGLREPAAYMALAAHKRAGTLARGRWRSVLKCLQRLVTRTWRPTEAVIIKPVDEANNLIPELLTLDRASRAIAIYSSLEDFLGQALKDPVRRRFARDRLRAAVVDAASLGSFDVRGWDDLTDAEAAALVWLAWVSELRHFATRFGSQTLLLNFAELLDRPAATARDMADFLGLSIPRRQLQPHVRGLLAVHAKDRRPYSRQRRVREAAEVQARYREEIEAGLHWAKARRPGCERW